MASLFLVRHGETAWNASARYMGHTDVPLSPTGYAQAELLRARLEGYAFDRAYASDLQRAAETARVILQGRETPLALRPELREIGYGQWEGKTHAEVLRDYPQELKEWGDHPWAYFPPDGEPYAAFVERVRSFADEIRPLLREENILVVAHGGPLRTLLCLFLDLEPDPWRFAVEPASLSIIEVNRLGGVVVSLINERCHLAETPA